MVEESDGEQVEAEASGFAGGAVSATAVLAFDAQPIRQRLADDEVVNALLLAMTRTENILSRMLRGHYGISREAFEELYGTNSMGSYKYKCETLGLIDAPEVKSVLNSLAEKRNNIAHDYGYMETLEENEEEREEVKRIVADVCDWIDSVELGPDDR